MEVRKEYTHKRRFPRRSFTRRLGVLVSGLYFIGDGVEISEGGLALVMRKGFVEGERVVLTFQIPDGGFISVTAEVRNSLAAQGGLFKTGLAFTNIKFLNKRQIRAYVSNRSETEQLAQ